MKSKLKFIIPIALVVMGGGLYKFVLAPPKKEPKLNVHGSVYVLPKEFLLNLADSRFAKLTVGLVLSHEDTSTLPAEGGHGAPAKPPEGFGPMNQEGLVRDLITDELTSARDIDLIESKGRKKLKEEILKRIQKSTDVKAEEILFTDVTVQ